MKRQDSDSGPRQFRQGDVLLIEVPRRPSRSRKVARAEGRIILALGEATGHAHAIQVPIADASVYETPASVRYVRLFRPATLRHEEHAPVHLPAGTFEVRIQREFLPETAERPLDLSGRPAVWHRQVID